LPIARKADGALRDALSALDQVLAFSGERITAEDVHLVLGLIEEELYLELFEILRERRAADVFAYVQRLVDGGYDLEEFYKGLGDALRLLLRMRLEDGEAMTGVSEQLSERYMELARHFAPGDLLRMLSALAELDTDGRFRKSEQQRILVEVTLLKFAMLDRTVELEQLMEAVRGEPPSNPNPGLQIPPAPARAKGPAPEKKRGRGPESAGGPPDPPAGGGEGSPDPVRSAWLEMITDARVLRPGQGIALRAVQISDLSADGELRVAAAKGTPAAEVLDDKVTRRRIEEELTRRLGRPIRIREEAQGESLPPRVSQETSKRQRLARLVDGDEGLQQIVDKLDLELMD
jgi:DNA polymerase-3 subunit gamma/tau